ncbi:hypothetical protein ABTN10_19990, partial [Acinetobacter baumannii]
MPPPRLCHAHRRDRACGPADCGTHPWRAGAADAVVRAGDHERLRFQVPGWAGARGWVPGVCVAGDCAAVARA